MTAPTTRLTIVADDLTGAADTASPFAAAGLATVVAFGDNVPPGVDVLARSTESRGEPVATATARVRAVFRAAASSPHKDAPVDACASSPSTATAEQTTTTGWFYKKIDSALRGCPAEDVLAAMTALDATRVLVAPALPSEGRTTVGGRQYLHGVPLERTRLGGDSDLVARFTSIGRVPVALLDLATVRNKPARLPALIAERTGVIVADAETDADLGAIARAVVAVHTHLCAGSAGLARALVDALPFAAKRGLPCQPARSGRPPLVVAGSRHEATSRQLARLADHGVRVIRLPQAAIEDPTVSLAALIDSTARALAAGQETAITCDGLGPCPFGGAFVANRLAQIAAAPVVVRVTGGLILTGGDVAAAVCEALGVHTMWLGGEVVPAIPWGVLAGPAVPGLAVVTKSGGFGADDALWLAVQHLRSITGSSHRRTTSAQPAQGTY